MCAVSWWRSNITAGRRGTRFTGTGRARDVRQCIPRQDCDQIAEHRVDPHLNDVRADGQLSADVTTHG
jgi:hypothetical protein